jgi:hypothetical protein
LRYGSVSRENHFTAETQRTLRFFGFSLAAESKRGKKQEAGGQIQDLEEPE